MKYYIGIDGGGTKTIGVLADENLKLIKSSKGLATNPLVVGFDISANRLLNLIKKLRGSKNIDSCVIGVAGVGRKNHSDLLLREIKRISKVKNFALPRIKIVTDIEIALEGAFNGMNGALLISGTGSILVAKKDNDHYIRIGGYGRLIGDEGSGFSIGRKALSSISKSIDGRTQRTELSDYFIKKYKISDINSLIRLVNSNGYNIAELAKLIIARAEKEDSECIRILDEEISELLLHISSLTKKIGTDKINLCFGGNLLATKNYYSKKLSSEIHRRFPSINIVKPLHTPEIGALLIAKKLFT